MDHTKYASLRVGDVNSNIANITNSYNTISNGSDEDRHIMQWLSPLEPQNRHHGVRSDRLEGVGDWLLETNEFREWRSGEGGADKAVLFCHGNPGVGKTFLNSLVMDRLYDRAPEDEITVAGVYCDFREQQEQTTANVMGAILKQLVVKKGQIVESIRNEFQKAKDDCGGRRPQLSDHVRMLKSTIAALPHALICIDALDEFTSKNLPELLLSLREIIREIPSIRVFLTGRPHVEEQITRFFAEAIMIPISPNSNDIEKYVEKKLEMDMELYAMNDTLRADVVRTIREKIAETFILVSLIIDAILAEPTISDRRKKLNEMTTGKGLGDAYGITLARMKAQSGSRPRLGLEALMWVSNAERPLQASELCHALAVEIGSTDLDSDKVPVIQTLLGCTLGLLTFEKASSTVRLVHYTLQEYLVNNSALFQSPHSMIAEVCLTYLNFPHIMHLSPTLDSAPPAAPLLDYASCYWGSHARKEMTKNVNLLAVKVLGEFDQHISSQLLLLLYNKERGWIDPRFDGSNGPEGFTGLHGAVYIGISEIVTTLFDMNKWGVNATDCMGMTALIWAVRRGHGEVVEMLLERNDVNPDTADTRGRTPLSWAAGDGYLGAVKILLERKDVNPDTADTDGGTPLWWAAAAGHEEVVETLLERKDVNPNLADTDGQTPLSWAAMKGHVGAVKILLERKDVNPDTTDTDGGTPLWWAAGAGYEGVVKILLERKDVNPDTADTKYGRTPLSRAAQEGHIAVVSLLLEREDLNPNPAETDDGRTPLMWAAEAGHDKVVETLLARQDLDLHTADFSGETALSLATSKGHSAVAELLTEHNRSLTNTPDIDEAPEDPLPVQLDLPQPSPQPAPPSPRLPTDSDTTPLDIDDAPECASPVPLDLPSSVSLDLPQPTPQPIPPSSSPRTDPETTPPYSRLPLRTLFGSCICWNRHNSRR